MIRLILCSLYRTRKPRLSPFRFYAISIHDPVSNDTTIHLHTGVTATKKPF